MKIDTDHLHYWMQAIRKSQNHLRTLDAFWGGQIASKEWLISTLEDYVKEPVSIEIHGGWVGVLSSLLFQSQIPIKSIVSLDSDAICEEIANEMNRLEFIDNRFKAVTKDMTEHTPTSDVVINTSCEHIAQEQYDKWLSNVTSQLLILQSNNYQIDEHIRTAESLEKFKEQSQVKTIWSGKKEFPLYSRWMIIGTK